MRKLGYAMIALLMTAAGALILSHLQLPSGTVAYRLSAPQLHSQARSILPRSTGTVDVNRASAEELESLPGVGPAIAQRILDEREQNGPFHYPEDLLAVKGIGQKTLEKLRDQICLP